MAWMFAEMFFHLFVIISAGVAVWMWAAILLGAI